MGRDAFLNRIAHVKRLLLDTNAIIYFFLNPLFHLFETNLPLPDAFIIATAKAAGCDAIIGNDQSWSRIDLPEVLLLDDYVNVL